MFLFYLQNWKTLHYMGRWWNILHNMAKSKALERLSTFNLSSPNSYLQWLLYQFIIHCLKMSDFINYIYIKIPLSALSVCWKIIQVVCEKFLQFVMKLSRHLFKHATSFSTFSHSFVSQMQSLTSCQCSVCCGCFQQHFTIAVRDKHIRDMVCPVCWEPDINDPEHLNSYFSTLDIQVGGQRRKEEVQTLCSPSLLTWMTD